MKTNAVSDEREQMRRWQHSPTLTPLASVVTSFSVSGKGLSLFRRLRMARTRVVDPDRAACRDLPGTRPVRRPSPRSASAQRRDPSPSRWPTGGEAGDGVARARLARGFAASQVPGRQRAFPEPAGTVPPIRLLPWSRGTGFPSHLDRREAPPGPRAWGSLRDHRRRNRAVVGAVVLAGQYGEQLRVGVDLGRVLPGRHHGLDRRAVVEFACRGSARRATRRRTPCTRPRAGGAPRGRRRAAPAPRAS